MMFTLLELLLICSIIMTVTSLVAFMWGVAFGVRNQTKILLKIRDKIARDGKL